MLDTVQPVVYMGIDEFTEYFKNACDENKTMIEDLGLAYYEQ